MDSCISRKQSARLILLLVAQCGHVEDRAAKVHARATSFQEHALRAGDAADRHVAALGADNAALHSHIASLQVRCSMHCAVRSLSIAMPNAAQVQLLRIVQRTDCHLTLADVFSQHAPCMPPRCARRRPSSRTRERLRPPLQSCLRAPPRPLRASPLPAAAAPRPPFPAAPALCSEASAPAGGPAWPPASELLAPHRAASRTSPTGSSRAGTHRVAACASACRPCGLAHGDHPLLPPRPRPSAAGQAPVSLCVRCGLPLRGREYSLAGGL